MNYERKDKETRRLRHTSVFVLHTSPRSGGFALIELLVAVTLFGLITVFVLLAYNRVGSQLFLSALAYEIALSFREAQSSGVSVHEFRVGAGGTFDVGYGLHFDDGSKNTFAMFADQGGVGGDGMLNGAYSTTYNTTGCLSTTECNSVVKFERGNTIYKFCGVLADDEGRDVADTAKHEECSLVTSPGVGSTPPANPPQTISYLDVTFLRPNPDATIKTSHVGQVYRAARVYVVSPTGERKVVEVVNTGQISIK